MSLIIYNEHFTIFIVTILIFMARVLDVSIGTLRVIYLSRGPKYLPPLLGFFEVLIWVIAAQQIMSNLSTPIYILAYALGFATGTYTGMTIEDKISTSKVLVRIITQKNGYGLEKKLNRAKCNVTAINAEGSSEKQGFYHVKLIFLIVQKKKVHEVLDVLRDYDSKAHYSIADVKYAHEDPEMPSQSFRSFGFFRKSK